MRLTCCNIFLLTMLTCVMIFSGCGGDDRGISGSGGSVGPSPSPSPPPSGTTYSWPDGSIAPWYMTVAPETGISPLYGNYTFTPTDPNGLNGKECFKVVEEADKKYIYFASDGYRFDKIEITNGSFQRTWGLGPDWPTDAYGISGCFTSNSKGEGLYKYAGRSQGIQGRTIFTIQLP